MCKNGWMHKTQWKPTPIQAWSRPVWHAMHSLTFTYPESEPSVIQKHSMRAYIAATADVLPCKMCREHFSARIADTATDWDTVLESRETLSKWLVNLHNSVNREKGKPIMTYSDAKAKYTYDPNMTLL